jgi:hypothetical protein
MSGEAHMAEAHTSAAETGHKSEIACVAILDAARSF